MTFEIKALELFTKCIISRNPHNLSSGERVRVSVKTGTMIPLPTKAEETLDYKDKKNYKVINTEMTFYVCFCS